MRRSSASDITVEMPSFATRSAESIVKPMPMTGTWKRCTITSAPRQLRKTCHSLVTSGATRRRAQGVRERSARREGAQAQSHERADRESEQRPVDPDELQIRPRSRLEVLPERPGGQLPERARYCPSDAQRQILVHELLGTLYQARHRRILAELVEASKLFALRADEVRHGVEYRLSQMPHQRLAGGPSLDVAELVPGPDIRIGRELGEATYAGRQRIRLLGANAVAKAFALFPELVLDRGSAHGELRQPGEPPAGFLDERHELVARGDLEERLADTAADDGRDGVVLEKRLARAEIGIAQLVAGGEIDDLSLDRLPRARYDIPRLLGRSQAPVDGATEPLVHLRVVDERIQPGTDHLLAEELSGDPIADGRRHRVLVVFHGAIRLRDCEPVAKTSHQRSLETVHEDFPQRSRPGMRHDGGKQHPARGAQEERKGDAAPREMRRALSRGGGVLRRGGGVQREIERRTVHRALPAISIRQR